MRVCQFRHDGKWTNSAAAGKPPPEEDLHIYSTGALVGVKLRPKTKSENRHHEPIRTEWDRIEQEKPELS